jgi:hypothetical protein
MSGSKDQLAYRTLSFQAPNDQVAAKPRLTESTYMMYDCTKMSPSFLTFRPDKAQTRSREGEVTRERSDLLS